MEVKHEKDLNQICNNRNWNFFQDLIANSDLGWVVIKKFISKVIQLWLKGETVSGQRSDAKWSGKELQGACN